MKVLVGAFNQEKALVGAFSVIVKTDWETDGSSAALVLGCVTVTTIICKQERKWLQDNETLSSSASELPLPLPIPVPAAGNIATERTQSIWCYLNRPRIVVHSFLFIYHLYFLNIYLQCNIALHCSVKNLILWEIVVLVHRTMMFFLANAQIRTALA